MSTTLAAAAIVAVVGVTQGQQYDFKVITAATTFNDAEQICNDPNGFQGHLASASSKWELDNLHSMVNQAGITGNFWVGGKRDASEAVRNENNWLWTDEKTFDSSPYGVNLWAFREPNDWKGKEDCLVVKIVDGAPKYNDAICLQRYPAVCQREHISNPLQAEAWVQRPASNCWYKYFNKVVGKRVSTFDRRTWFDAQGYCRAHTPVSQQGNLVSINDQAESDFIKDMIQTRYQDFPWRPIWIGLRRTGSDQFHSWSNGNNAQSFTNWMANEPNNKVHEYLGEEHCTQMSHSSAKRDIDNGVAIGSTSYGQWNDASCGRKRGWVCEVCV